VRVSRSASVTAYKKLLEEESKKAYCFAVLHIQTFVVGEFFLTNKL
jgi:hypothetical protein